MHTHTHIQYVENLGKLLSPAHSFRVFFFFLKQSCNVMGNKRRDFGVALDEMQVGRPAARRKLYKVGRVRLEMTREAGRKKKKKKNSIHSSNTLCLIIERQVPRALRDLGKR